MNYFKSLCFLNPTKTQNLLHSKSFIRNFYQPSSTAAVKPQMYKRLVILDFEATCDQDEEVDPREIIEFPSVILDVETLSITGEFQKFVKPVHHPILSDFCKDLTKISQEQINDAETFTPVFYQYMRWLYENRLITQTGDASDFCFVIFDNWDLKTMLGMEINSREEIARPSCFNTWIDARQAFTDFYSNKSFRGGLQYALHSLNLKPIGRAHSGLDDCKNTAQLIVKYICDGFVLKPTWKSKTPPRHVG